jgi:Na+-transporting methylmalonyl-CoA/oxaloacetate decarboxylase beta subunit
MDVQTLIAVLTEGIRTFTWANAVMLAIGTLLIYLAIVRRYEPLLLLPIGAGCLFANLGMSAYTPGRGWPRSTISAFAPSCSRC